MGRAQRGAGESTRRWITLCTIPYFLFPISPADGADLLEIYRLAQSADTQYAAARASWAASQEKLPQGLSGLLPSASVGVTVQNSERDTQSATTGTVVPGRSSSTATASVNQPIYRPQRYAAYEQSKTQVAQADAVLAQAAQDLILRVAQAYLDVLLAQDTVAFAQAQLTAIGQQLEQAKRNFEVGTATITDTHEAQSRYDITTSTEIAARNDLEIRKRQLELLIGRATPGLSPLGARFSLRLPQPGNMDQWVADAVEDRKSTR